MRVGDSYCPGILHAVPAKDGLLMRVRVPGGLITAKQLRTAAKLSSACGDGRIEITSRANLQLRGITPENLGPLVEGLEAAELLPSRSHDRVRNIVASPFAGLHPQESINTCPLVADFDRALCADLDLAALPPKFCIAFDGGGPWFHQEEADLTLRVPQTEHGICFQLLLYDQPIGMAISAEQAINSLLHAAKLCLSVARQFALPARGKAIIAHSKACAAFRAKLSSLLRPDPAFPARAIQSDIPLGIVPTKHTGMRCIVPSIPYGFMNAEQSASLAGISEQHQSTLCLAPWRGIVLGEITAQEVSPILRSLTEIGLPADNRSGHHGLFPCAGTDGCDTSLADVRADAASLAGMLAGQGQPSEWAVNLSGCGKRCGMRKNAAADLIANEVGYSILINGVEIAAQATAASAIGFVMKRHSTTTIETCTWN